MKTISILLTIVCAINTLLFAQNDEPAISPLVSAEWLQAQIESFENLVILDVRSKEDYDAGHIPKSQHANYASWFEERNGLPGYLPAMPVIQAQIRVQGIDENSHVVLVSGVNKQYSFGRAARIYWTLKISGLNKLSILDGGMEAWNSEQLALSTDSTAPTPSFFVVSKYDTSLIETLETAKEAVDSKTTAYIYVDARPQEQYLGYKKHKFARVGGTIQGAVNLSQYDFTNADGTLKSIAELTQLVDAKVLDKSAKLVTFCNMGHGSATDWFVFSEILGKNASLYDGSYNEWSADRRNPIENKKKRSQIKDYFKKKEQS